MRPLFIIRLDEAMQASWLDADSHLVRGELREAAAPAAGRRVVVLVPGEQVLLTQVRLPTRKRQKAAAAVPYLLEDQVAGDVETLHFALGVQDQAGRCAVAVVDKGLMEQWLAALQEAGLRPAVLMPDVLALPRAEGEWTLVLEGGRALLRTGPGTGLAMESQHLDLMLEGALAEAEGEAPAALRLFAGPGGRAPDLARAGLTVNVKPLPGALLNLAGETLDERDGINLLQGTYSVREQLGKAWRPWRPAAVLLLAVLALQATVTIVTYRSASAELDALRDEVKRIYLDAFPAARRVVNVRAQTEQRLKALRGGGKGSLFMGMLARVSAALTAAPGAAVQRLAYKEGELQLALTIGDLQQLEQLKTRLQQERLDVDIQSATSRNKRVEARLVIRGTAS
ncbi:MAG TPA: type II secretion system protein GspL [Gammaproteobacteria bacterium]|nr:type II secretion system protein GspL [Gammaproteobacteria bacterium]